VITGNFQTARELSILAYQDDSRPRKGLCYMWNRIQANEQGNVEAEELASEMLEKFECVP
jgi:hypothetical protein